MRALLVGILVAAASAQEPAIRKTPTTDSGPPAIRRTGEGPSGAGASAPAAPPDPAKIPQALLQDPGRLVEFLFTDKGFAAAASDPAFQRLVARLAGRGSRLGDGEEGYYRVLLTRLPEAPWLRAELGRRAFDRKDYRSALKEYEEAVKHDPTDQESLVKYGLSAYELGDFELAGKAAAQALARDPSNQDAHALRGYAAGRAPVVRLPSALFHAGAASEEAADEAAGLEGFANLGERPLAGGGAPGPGRTPEQAIAEFKAFPAPDPIAASRALTRDSAAALSVRDYPVAHGLAGRAFALNDRNAQALNYRAIAAGRMGRLSEAEADASAALGLAPGSVPILQTRALVRARQGRWREALSDADESLALEPENATAHHTRAVALAGLGDRVGALAELRRSAAIDERFQPRLDTALQAPESADLALLLLGEEAPDAAASVPAPRRLPSPGRFLRLAVFSVIGGLLVALGVLHVVSASWREKVGATVRRVLNSPRPAGAAAAGPRGDAPPSPGGSAFWTQHELVRMIGVGGMGMVYEAVDKALERRVAVKRMRGELRLDPSERAHFVREARLVAQLRHPGIADIFGIVEEGEDIYLVFEFIEGRTLADALKAEGRFPLDQAKRVLRAVAEAVEHAHSRRIIHRDLKPSNIMLAADGRVKVMDFGVARQAKEALSRLTVTSVAGTPPYMAPEQEDGGVRPESDVFALGVCLYEMLTGRLPFSGGPGAMYAAKSTGRHEPPSRHAPGLPPAVDALMARALFPDPERRFRTPSELAAALDAV